MVRRLQTGHLMLLLLLLLVVSLVLANWSFNAAAAAAAGCFAGDCHRITVIASLLHHLLHGKGHLSLKPRKKNRRSKAVQNIFILHVQYDSGPKSKFVYNVSDKEKSAQFPEAKRIESPHTGGNQR